MSLFSSIVLFGLGLMWGIGGVVLWVKVSRLRKGPVVELSPSTKHMWITWKKLDRQMYQGKDTNGEKTLAPLRSGFMWQHKSRKALLLDKDTGLPLMIKSTVAGVVPGFVTLTGQIVQRAVNDGRMKQLQDPSFWDNKIAVVLLVGFAFLMITVLYLAYIVLNAQQPT